MGNTNDTSPLFGLTKAGRELIWRRWNDTYIVYQRTSGETHAFNETTAEILRCLQGGPSTLKDLVARIAASLDIDPTDLSSTDFQRLLNRLEHLGMAEWLNRPGTRR